MATKYDPDLARRFNEKVELEKRLEAKRKAETVNFVMKRLFWEVVRAKKWITQKKCYLNVLHITFTD